MINKITSAVNITSAKRARQKRYEARTLNKPCTVRAHPHEHAAIKKYAKTGQCSTCQKHVKNFILLKNTVNRQRNGPIKWTDQFTYRDALMSLISVSVVFVALVINNLVNRALI